MRPAVIVLLIVVSVSVAVSQFIGAAVHTSCLGSPIGRQCQSCGSSNILCRDLTENGPYRCNSCGNKSE